MARKNCSTFLHIPFACAMRQAAYFEHFHLRLFQSPADCRSLNRPAKLTISGRTKISARLIGFLSWMPSSEVQRLSATYACPPANTPPVKSITTLLKVNLNFWWTVMAQASRMGYWAKLPSTSSSISFCLSLCDSGCYAMALFTSHILCRHR